MDETWEVVELPEPASEVEVGPAVVTNAPAVETDAPAVVTLVILGETGHGKSAIVNALRDAAAPEAAVGLSPDGVTVEICSYRGSEEVRPAWHLVDTPGIGSARTPLVQQLVDLEALLAGEQVGPIHGVLVTCPADSSRLMLGTRIAQGLIDLGHASWERVVLVGTKADRADAESIRFFEESLVPAFFGSASGPGAGRHAVVGKDNLGQLVDTIRGLPSEPLTFQRPDAQQLSERLAGLLGEEHPEELQRQLEAVRRGECPQQGPPLNLVVIGECGDGKSTLINHLRDPAASEPLPTGKAPRGVTKEIARIAGLPIGGRPLWIFDTPGIGDMDVPPVELISLLESALSGAVTGGVDGVLITCLTTNRYVRLGGQVVRTLIDLGFQGEDKWKSVILVGTKADRAEPEEVENFRRSVVQAFFPAEGGGQAAVCSCGAGGVELEELRSAVLALPTRQVVYSPPASAELAAALGQLLGLEVGATAQTIDDRRVEHKLISELRRLSKRHEAERERAQRELCSCKAQLQLQEQEGKRNQEQHEEELRKRRQCELDAQMSAELQWREELTERSRQQLEHQQAAFHQQLALEEQKQENRKHEMQLAMQELAEQQRLAASALQAVQQRERDPGCRLPRLPPWLANLLGLTGE